MAIIRRKRQSEFAIIPNAVADDKRLSFEARGLLCHLLAKPHNWQLNVRALAKEGGIGRDKAYKLVKQLIEAGYVAHEVVRCPKSQQIVRHEYLVFDQAVPNELSLRVPLPENQDMASPVPENQEVGEPHPDLPDPEKPYPANQDGLIRTELTKDPAQTIPNRDGPGPLVNAFLVDIGSFIRAWQPTQAPGRDVYDRWNRLKDQEQNDAYSHVMDYRRLMFARGEKNPSMVAYLAEKRWQDFISDPPPISPDGRFIIDKDRPEFMPWMLHLETTEVRERFTQIMRAGVYHAPCRFPPQQGALI
jgi:hypothetical protein